MTLDEAIDYLEKEGFEYKLFDRWSAEIRIPCIKTLCEAGIPNIYYYNLINKFLLKPVELHTETLCDVGITNDENFLVLVWLFPNEFWQNKKLFELSSLEQR